jgi:hypothetical protein
MLFTWAIPFITAAIWMECWTVVLVTFPLSKVLVRESMHSPHQFIADTANEKGSKFSLSMSGFAMMLIRKFAGIF